ncbi:transglycosylase SLT domain-containing protein [Methylobacterium sp. NEAU 140]|uniref:lytic transglycosylase domain-containing protein n=1 Tax=Methylobacterium sp. NEAU 140 TaxID=3064945 RepID=UPI0027359B44|nr:transglycosylase SLT domain-containing protein [Methylobacterium sp. NEAU 140]MDP4022767.1 transglycosylase SLT domain-containing protein [Methylobacterium sp. NEAU 140]
MRVPSALLLLLYAGTAQARPATFVTVHARGMAALPALPPPVRVAAGAVAAPTRVASASAASANVAPARTASGSAAPTHIATASIAPARTASASVAPAGAASVSAVPVPVGARACFLPLIAREVAATGLPLAIADAVAQIESGYDPTVVGSVGEVGLMQVRPTTAAMLGFRGTVAELSTPEVNVRYGVRYLAAAWRLAEGDLCRALMKYRAGHGSETMSPLSQVYCARAQAILGGAVPAGRPASPAARWAVAAARPKARPETEPAPAPRTFWEAHRARVARLNARVLAAWRARGWKSG